MTPDCRNATSRFPEAPDLLCILGPTAVGKTGAAVALARYVNGEIISADSRQVYRGMDIGTGKDLADYTAGGAPISYHLIDVVDAGTEFSVFDYQQAFFAAYASVKSSGRLPIFCGGTGLYLDAVLKPYRLVNVPPDPTLRAQLRRKTNLELVAHLTRLRRLHNTTDTCDRDRLIRAIEIAEHTERHTPPDPMPRLHALVFGLRMERRALKTRITARLRERLDHGLIEEVRALIDRGVTPERLVRYGLEYRFVTEFVSGNLSRNDMFQKLNAAIYQFARRQEKWFRRMERQGTVILWLDATEPRQAIVERMLERLRATRVSDSTSLHSPPAVSPPADQNGH